MISIEKLIEDASHDMFNPVLNFEIAKKYEELEQTASAVSFYLRAAEYGHDTHPTIAYASLLKVARCFEDQANREHSVSNALLQAIQYMPARPEGYFLLSRFYERSQKWQECYTFAEMGMMYTTRLDQLPADVEYPGAFVLLFEITLLTTASETTATCVGLDMVPDELTDIVVGGAVVDNCANCVG